jgi:hypothetical protein
MSQEVQKPRIRPFVEVLAEIEGGSLLIDIEEGLTNVIAAVQDVRKAGMVQLQLQLVPTGKGTVTMHANLTLKEPKHPRTSTTFFVDDRFQCYRDDPRQEKMDLREPETPAEAPKEVPKDEQPLRVVGEPE